MCLKEYYTITFSNREAYGRALKLVEGFIKLSLHGTFYKIIRWKIDQTEPRKDYSFEQLFGLWDSQFPWILVDEIDFDNHSTLKTAIEKIGDHEDIFGKIEVEIR